MLAFLFTMLARRIGLLPKEESRWFEGVLEGADVLEPRELFIVSLGIVAEVGLLTAAGAIMAHPLENEILMWGSLAVVILTTFSIPVTWAYLIIAVCHHAWSISPLWRKVCRRTGAIFLAIYAASFFAGSFPLGLWWAGWESGLPLGVHTIILMFGTAMMWCAAISIFIDARDLWIASNKDQPCSA